MTSLLDSHRLPRLEARAPTTLEGTVGRFIDRNMMAHFREQIVQASGVTEPTVIALNLEGWVPDQSMLLELVVPLGRAARMRTLGPLAIVLCTEDEAWRVVLDALAQTQDLALFIAPSVERLSEAVPLGSLTPTEHETLNVLHRLGGRVTVANFAGATGLEANAATNRLVNVTQKGFIHRVQRPGRDPLLFVDPRAARPAEDPADPTSADFALPEPLRRDVQALAEMRELEPGEPLAAAWHELLAVRKAELEAEHDAMREAIKRGDKAELARLAKRFAKKQAEARARLNR